jgi:hypothetical protein
MRTLADQLAEQAPELGPSPRLVDGSAGRTELFAGNGLTCKVFLVPSDKPDREIAARAGAREFARGYAENGDITSISSEQVGYFVADRVLDVFGATGRRWNRGLDARAGQVADRLLADDLPGATGFPGG